MENAILYIIPFLTAFLFSVGLTLLIILLVKKFSVIGKIGWRKSKRHIHKKNVVRWGGVAIIISFVGAIFLDKNLVISNSLWGILFGSGIILILGIADDIWNLDWRFQLFFQICATIIVFIAGVQIDCISNPLGGLIYLKWGASILPGLFLGVFWIILVMNAVNWLDGIDGLSGGVSLLVAIAIFALSLKPEVNQPPVGIISMIFAGAVLGFLIFNFYPARIMAGTSGALFMGFVLASLSIFAGTKIATTLLVLAIPIIDSVGVIIQRIYHQKSIFQADSRHLHYKLLQLGWSQKKIALFFYGFTTVLLLIAVNMRTLGKTLAILLAIVAMIIMFVIIEKKQRVI